MVSTYSVLLPTVVARSVIFGFAAVGLRQIVLGLCKCRVIISGDLILRGRIAGDFARLGVSDTSKV